MKLWAEPNCENEDCITLTVGRGQDCEELMERAPGCITKIGFRQIIAIFASSE